MIVVKKIDCMVTKPVSKKLLNYNIRSGDCSCSNCDLRWFPQISRRQPLTRRLSKPSNGDRFLGSTEMFPEHAIEILFADYTFGRNIFHASEENQKLMAFVLENSLKVT
jgi:hypothetical protein